jgi:hypothetical protein
MSKKLAEGIDALVLDVKVGNGAFMRTAEQARELARTMAAVGAHMGKAVVAYLTDMNQPLGQAIGNALEVRETIDVLRGCGPADVRELTLVLAEEMLRLGGVDPARAREALESGAALARFREIVEAQGGDPAAIDDPSRLPTSRTVEPFVSPASGYLVGIDTRAVGTAAICLGAGRNTKDDVINPAVGFMMNARLGDAVTAGEPLLFMHHDGVGVEAARALLAEAFTFGPAPLPPTPPRPRTHRQSDRLITTEVPVDTPPNAVLTALSQHSVDVPLSARLVSLMGLFALMGLAWLAGTRSRVIPWRVVLWGLALQVGFALFVLRTPWGMVFFQAVNDGANTLLGYAYQGLGFVFGRLVTESPPVLAFGPLAAIVFFAALMSVLYHLRVMQAIVWAFDVAMRRTMRTSGAETLSAAANIFVGQTEAPLLVRPYVQRMTRSELMAVMVGGASRTPPAASSSPTSVCSAASSPIWPGIC